MTESGESSAHVAADGDPLRSLTAQVAGEAVIRELLGLQAEEPPRSRSARIFGRSPLAADALPWYVGALGERAVGDILARLGDDWTVLHSIPVGDGASDIDHLAIGPGGVITINTKSHAEKQIWVDGPTFTVAGRKLPYIRYAEFESRRVTAALSSALPTGFEVTPAIVVLDPASITVREQPATVAVLDARQLTTWIRNRGTLLSATQVQAIADAAGRPETWRGAVPVYGPLPDSAGLLANFEAFLAEMRQARRRRIVWILLALAALLVAVIAVAPLVLGLVDATVVREL